MIIQEATKLNLMLSDIRKNCIFYVRVEIRKSNDLGLPNEFSNEKF